MNVGAVFWDIVPYVTIAILVVGTWWRYRYDKFGWTTRSSQLYESRLLRIGSPLFHFGILVVIFGHVIGLLIPESWTSAVGLSQEGYHIQAVALGSIAGIATLTGAAILVYRRRTKGPVFMATTKNDKLMYLVLILAIIAGLATTLVGSGLIGEEHNYRETVSIWFRSIFILQPDGEAMTLAPLSFQIHALIGMALFALWPFTRLVHAFSAPVALPLPALHRLPLPRSSPPRRTDRVRATPPRLVGMCNYCGCREIPMIAKLNAEHDAIVNSTYALQVASREHNVESAKTAGKILAELLHPHTHREQVGLFAEMNKDELFTEHIASLCAEHDELDDELELIAAGDMTRITAMITLLNNHIDREENGLFPAALAYLDDTQWDTIQRPELMGNDNPPAPHEHHHPDANSHDG